MTDALNDHEGTVSIGGRNITNLRFADDIDGLARREDELADLVECIDKTSTAFGMQINAEKTKLMTNNTNGFSTDIRVNDEKLDCVKRFKYLGAIITDEGSNPDILARIAQATAALAKLKTIWNDRNIALSSKIRLMRSLVMSIFLYACESWTLTAETEKKIQAMEMRCLRKLLGITYREHITTERGPKQNSASHWTTRRPPDHNQTTKTEMVRPHKKINRACQDGHARYSPRREKTRQAEKEMGRQYPGMDGLDTGRRHEESRETRGVEGAGCQVICGAPNGPLRLRDRQGKARQEVNSILSKGELFVAGINVILI